MERANGKQDTLCGITSHPSPVPQCVFVTVNEARRYLVTSIKNRFRNVNTDFMNLICKP
jgi:hypothetical protein